MRKVREKLHVDFTPGGKIRTSKEYTTSPDEEIKELLVHQITRIITKLFKNQLTLLEDVQSEHKSSLKRVEDLVSEDFIKMIDFLDGERYGHYRKKVLDSGNESIREIERLLESFEIKIKK